MTESILQAYLNEQHIKTDVNENFDSLKKAVKEVIAFLTKKKGKAAIIPFALVALDPMVQDADPVVQQVESIIIKNWPAFKNGVTATKDKSTTYIRAVILESLSQMSKADAATAALVWLTARDVIKYFHLGSEEGAISRLLQELANQTENNGQAAWGISQKLKIIEFKGSEISISEVKSPQINQEKLKGYLLDAMVHSGWKANAGGGENPHSQGQNNWQWPKFMAEHSAMGITEVVNFALSQQAKSLSSIPTSIKGSLDAYFAQIQPFIEGLSTSLASSISANNKRSELLWWKQSLYSRLLNTGYRSLNLLNVAVCMALDLAEQVDAIYPESVDYLLRESLKDVHGEPAEEERLFTDWLKDADRLHGSIRSALNQYAVDGGERKPLLSALVNVVQSGEITSFFTETGIDKNAKLTASDLTVWLFHGLQAQKLTIDK
ncbi:MAG TPA: GTPase-associated system all-helical protein GASH [Saprospiraceae bacterium]|nr:GTPase-associated system all-helical protein GASH [Saprospiraceae bacterium]